MLSANVRAASAVDVDHNELRVLLRNERNQFWLDGMADAALWSTEKDEYALSRFQVLNLLKRIVCLHDDGKLIDTARLSLNRRCSCLQRAYRVKKFKLNRAGSIALGTVIKQLPGGDEQHGVTLNHGLMAQNAS